MFSSRLAFVDVETTGGSPQRDRVTEVGIVSVDWTGEEPRVEEWSSLVNPQARIPPEISWLTGITNEMVRDAPVFAELAGDVAARLEGAIFVAHNARFDYGFLKNEFARCDLPFTARTLCTVRLSRDLHPDRGPHSLDAIIERHDLPVSGRHRALGDARVLWEFLRKLHAAHGSQELESAVGRLLKRPSLPAHLPPDALADVPHAPGLYLFHGLNEHPIYIGKSIDLRDRVGSHFTNDHASARDLRLSQETRRIEWQATAGEFGALLLEQRLIKERMPAHNIALRRKSGQVVLRFASQSVHPVFVPAAEMDLDHPELHYGVFASRPAARRALSELAALEGLCLKTMGLERRARAEPPDAPCFNLQIRRCRGACVGAESPESHALRLAAALEPLRMPAWPATGPIGLIERSADGLREDVHVLDRWCWLGTVKTLEAARELARSGPPLHFEADSFRLLRAALERPDPPRTVPL